MKANLAESLLNERLIEKLTGFPPTPEKPWLDAKTGTRRPAFTLRWSETFAQTRVDGLEGKYRTEPGCAIEVRFLYSKDPANAAKAFREAKVKAVIEGLKKAIIFAEITGLPTCAIVGCSGWSEPRTDDVTDRPIRREILAQLKPHSNDLVIIGFDGDHDRVDSQVGSELVTFATELSLHGLRTHCVDFGYRELRGQDGEVVERARNGADDWFAMTHQPGWEVGWGEKQQDETLAAVWALPTVPLAELEANARWSMSTAQRYLKSHAGYTDLGAATKLLQLAGEDKIRFIRDTGQWAVYRVPKGETTARWVMGDKLPVEVTEALPRFYHERARPYLDSANAITGEDYDANDPGPIREEKIQRRAKKKTLLGKAQAIQKWANKLEDERTMNGIVNNIARRESQAALSSDFDSNPMILAIPGGKVVELDKGNNIRDEVQADLVTLRTRARYTGSEPTSPGARKAKKFLTEIFARPDGTPDPARETLIRRQLGSGAFGFNPLEGAVFLTGGGSNGKSTLSKILLAAVGDYGAAIDTAHFVNPRFEKDPEAANPFMFTLLRRRWVIGDEFDPKDYLFQKFFKKFTGGGYQSIRSFYNMYKLEVKYKIIANLIFTTNDMPRLNKLDYATIRRINIMPMLRTWYTGSKDDPRLPKGAQAANTELIGLLEDDEGAQDWLLWWLLEGAREWWESGGTVESGDGEDGGGDAKYWRGRSFGEVPEEVRAAKEEYIESEDVFSEFMDDSRLEFVDVDERGARYEKFDLYDAYRNFKKNVRKQEHVEAEKPFRKAFLKWAGARVELRESGGKYWYYGIKLRLGGKVASGQA